MVSSCSYPFPSFCILYLNYFVFSDTFIKNPDGTEYVGQVWPGYTVFPDWFAENAQKYWTEALTNWSNSGVEFSGIWLDMNEASSFCDGSWYVMVHLHIDLDADGL